MMNKWILAASCLIVGLALFEPRMEVNAQDFYDTKYDNIDLDNILASKRLVRNYMNCVFGKGACTPEGSYLAQVLPEALKTECAKCSEKQKQAAVKVLKKLSADYPEEWKEISVRFDPNGDLWAKFQAANL